MTTKIFGAQIALCTMLPLVAAADKCLYKCEDFSGSRVCITDDLLCNHFPDGDDGRDETNCGCEGFTCESDGVCKDSSRLCDGFNNCFDKSDEIECTKAQYRKRFPSLPEGDLCKKPCGSHGSCSFTSDGEAICLCNNGYSGVFCDTQDLAPTTDSSTLQKRVLREEKFVCGTQEVSRKLICDGHIDCDDQSDEVNCTIHDYERARPHLSRRFLCLMPCKRSQCFFDHEFKASCPCPEKSDGVFCEKLVQNTMRPTQETNTSASPAMSAPEAEGVAAMADGYITSAVFPAIGVAGLALVLWLLMKKPWASRYPESIFASPSHGILDAIVRVR